MNFQTRSTMTNHHLPVVVLREETQNHYNLDLAQQQQPPAAIMDANAWHRHRTRLTSALRGEQHAIDDMVLEPTPLSWYHLQRRQLTALDDSDPALDTLALFFLLEEFVLRRQRQQAQMQFPQQSSSSSSLWNVLQQAWQAITARPAVHFLVDASHADIPATLLVDHASSNNDASLWSVPQRLRTAVRVANTHNNTSSTTDDASTRPTKRLRRILVETNAVHAVLILWLTEAAHLEMSHGKKNLSLDKDFLKLWSMRAPAFSETMAPAVWWATLDRFLSMSSVSGAELLDWWQQWYVLSEQSGNGVELQFFGLALCWL